MKTIRPISRRQMSLAACGLALLAVLTIIPWQVVAQEAKPNPKPAAQPELPRNIDLQSDPPKQNPPLAPGVKADAGPPSDHALPAVIAVMKKQIVGTWKGGFHPSDDMTFHDDGTFERNYRTWITPGNDPNIQFLTLSGDQLQRGRWTIGERKIPIGAGKENTIIALNLEILRDGCSQPLWMPTEHETQSISGWMAENRNDQPGTTGEHKVWYSIEQLNKEFLRLKIYEGPQAVTTWTVDNGKVTYMTSPTMFYRRADSAADKPTYDAKLSEECRRLATLVQLTPDEATKFSEIINSRQVADGPLRPIHNLIDPANVELIERIDAAKHHKIGFAKLYDLNNDELEAFRDLMRQVDGHYGTALMLDKNSLSKTEQSALKKLQDLSERLARLQSDAVNDGTPQTETQDPSVGKLSQYLIELADWLNSTVYNVPQEKDRAVGSP